MNRGLTPKVWLAPVSFGYGPASHALAIAAALRSLDGEATVGGIADGAVHDFLSESGCVDLMLPAAMGSLPEGIRPCPDTILVCVGDFERAMAAKKRGLRVMIVDALYWMWDTEPIDPGSVDTYFCLSFPGVSERIATLHNSSRPSSMHVIPQILGGPLPPIATERRGALLNLGGAVSPFGANLRYLSTLIRIAADALAPALDDEELLVTCSAQAASGLRAAGVPPQVRIEELSWARMMDELGGRRLLLTVPGLSIVWEAGAMGIPTILVPGTNYSQHQQVDAYRGLLPSETIIDWDALPGYSNLPAGLSERDGVRGAIDIGDRFGSDSAAQCAMGRALHRLILADAARPPAKGTAPFGGIDGARHVATQILQMS